MFKGSLVKAKYVNARISPKKVASIMDIVRGMSLERAKVVLAFDFSKASQLILKVLKSAEANAKNNFNLDLSKLYISEIWVSPARMVRTGQAGSKGRFDPIIKRSSHIYLGLNEKKSTKKGEKAL